MDQPEQSQAVPRDYLAAERTFLAWIRTGLALMGLGFVLARFGIFLRQFSFMRPGSATASFAPSLVWDLVASPWRCRLPLVALSVFASRSVDARRSRLVQSTFHACRSGR